MTRIRLLSAVVAVVAATSLLVLVAPQASQASLAGTPDVTAPVSGEVYAVAQVGNRTIIGGDFTAVGGVPRRNVAAIRADGSVDPTFDPSPDGTVQAVAGSADGSRIFIGGTFNNVLGAARQNLAAVDATSGAAIGTWDANTDGTVYALASSGNRVYAGGTFTTIDGAARRRLAAVDQQTGAVQTGFNPFPNWTVKTIQVSPDGARVFAAGGFSAIGGAQRRAGAGEVLATTGQATPFNPTDGGVAIASALSPDGSRYWFSTSNNRIHAYDPAVSNSPVYSIQTSGDTQAIAASDTEVYFGGHFSQVQTHRVKRLHIASIRASDGAITNWNPGADGFLGVWAMAVTPTHVLVGGDFTRIGGRTQPGFARFALAAQADVTAPTVPSNVTSPAQTQTSIDLAWNPSVDSVGVHHYEVFVDGALAATPTTTNATISGLTAETSYSLEVSAVDAAGNRSERSPALSVSTLPASSGQTTDLVAPGATWRYRDDGSDQGTAWHQAGFDDSTWAQGPAQLGFGEGDEATLVTRGWLTYYFRHGFTVTDAANVSSLTVQLMVDDGAVVYLNGVELARDNMPAGTITANSYASAGRWGAEENVWRSFNVPASALVEGANVLAVEVHQDYRGSNDLSFDARLDAALR